MEAIVTFCDYCNSKYLVENPHLLGDELVELLGMADARDYNGQVWINRGVRTGTFADAEGDGWEERDYGHMCPYCILEEKPQDDDGASIGLEALDDGLKSGQNEGE